AVAISIRKRRPSRLIDKMPERQRWRSMLVDQARRRAVRENAAVFVGQLAFGGADTAPVTDDLAFRFHQAGLRGDGPYQRNLELERRLRKALVQHRVDGEPHA